MLFYKSILTSKGLISKKAKRYNESALTFQDSNSEENNINLLFKRILCFVNGFSYANHC